MGDQMSKLFVDVEEFDYDTGYGWFKLAFLGFVYGYILFVSANLIGDGSELLQLDPKYKGIVGPVVIPILGAVPDGAIVLFSGMGSNAQEQLLVGVGALAGSTIMLLTLPWGLAVIAGRVKLMWDVPNESGDMGLGTYVKPSKSVFREQLIAAGNPSPSKADVESAHAAWRRCPDDVSSWMQNTGINCDESIKMSAKWMLVTSIGYLIIQVPGIGLGCIMKDQTGKCGNEQVWAWIGLVYCLVAFCAYLLYQMNYSVRIRTQEREARIFAKFLEHDHIDIDFEVVFAEMIRKMKEHRETQTTLPPNSANVSLGSPLEGKAEDTNQPFLGGAAFDETRRDVRAAVSEEEWQNASQLVRKLVKKFGGSDALLTVPQLKSLMLEVFNMKMRNEEVEAMHQEMDKNHDGSVSHEEFVSGLFRYFSTPDRERVLLRESQLIRSCTERLSSMPKKASTVEVITEQQTGEEEEEEGEEEEEEEMPEDIDEMTISWEAKLDKAIKRAFYQMGVGTLLVVLFSDPMVDVLSTLGTKTNIPSFFVAFVLAPIASNATELLAAYNYALKKTVSSVTLSLSQLLGAACMNNTFCLGIFLALIALRDLRWVFSAETISIFFIELIMFYFATKSVHRVLDAVYVLSLFPISIILVVILEYVLKLN